MVPQEVIHIQFTYRVILIVLLNNHNNTITKKHSYSSQQNQNLPKSLQKKQAKLIFSNQKSIDSAIDLTINKKSVKKM